MNQATMPSNLTSNFLIVDTLQLAKRLQKAGLAQEISEELAEVISETQGKSVETLATKEDLLEIEKTSKQEFKAFEESQKHDLKAVRQDIKTLEHNIELRFKNLESGFDQKIQILRTEMEILKKDVVIKLGSLMAVGISIIAMLIKF